jgi:hypothetical protein
LPESKERKGPKRAAKTEEEAAPAVAKTRARK